MWDVTRMGSAWAFTYRTEMSQTGFVLVMSEPDAMALLQLLNSSGAKPR